MDMDIVIKEGDKLRDRSIWELPMILSDCDLSCQWRDPSLGGDFTKIPFSDSYLFFILKWLYSMMLVRKTYNKKNLIRMMLLSEDSYSNTPNVKKK